jgi:hypothetical protein
LIIIIYSGHIIIYDFLFGGHEGIILAISDTIVKFFEQFTGFYMSYKTLAIFVFFSAVVAFQRRLIYSRFQIFETYRGCMDHFWAKILISQGFFSRKAFKIDGSIFNANCALLIGGGSIMQICMMIFGQLAIAFILTQLMN